MTPNEMIGAKKRPPGPNNSPSFDPFSCATRAEESIAQLALAQVELERCSASPSFQLLNLVEPTLLGHPFSPGFAATLDPRRKSATPAPVTCSSRFEGMPYAFGLHYSYSTLTLHVP